MEDPERRSAGRPKLQYRLSKDGDSYELPSNETIIKDFKACGGSFLKFLKTYAPAKDNRPLLASEVLLSIYSSKEDKDAWEQVRIVAEQAEALIARDVLIDLANTDGGTMQIQALKLVREFAKDHVGKTREPIDEHLEGIEDDEP